MKHLFDRSMFVPSSRLVFALTIALMALLAVSLWARAAADVSTPSTTSIADRDLLTEAHQINDFLVAAAGISEPCAGCNMPEAPLYRLRAAVTRCSKLSFAHPVSVGLNALSSSLAAACKAARELPGAAVPTLAGPRDPVPTGETPAEASTRAGAAKALGQLPQQLAAADAALRGKLR